MGLPDGKLVMFFAASGLPFTAVPLSFLATLFVLTVIIAQKKWYSGACTHFFRQIPELHCSR